jgi:hypothetical protein
MVFSISTKMAVAVVALLAASVHGHIIMTEPAPFEFANPSTAQSPLDAGGADFPCKFPAGFTPKDQAPAPMKAGADANILSFKGGATHGGGSCQVSITSDKVPTKNSKWEVLKSIEGGCPSDAPGNLGNDASAPIPTTFKYGIPGDLAPGTYTIAWTWFNKIGNREMYMNCAPVQVGGGAAKRQAVKINKKRQSARPEMFTANIGNGCSTTETTDVTFPDPGANLQKGDKAVPGPPVGNCGATGAQPAGSSNSTSSGTPTGDAAPAGSSAAPAGSSAAAAPAAASSSAGAPRADPSATAAVGAAAPTGAAGSASGAGQACSPEGMFVCASDGSSFTRCASGTMSVPQQMEAGMKCTPGQGSTLNTSPSRRSVKFDAAF